MDDMDGRPERADPTAAGIGTRVGWAVAGVSAMAAAAAAAGAGAARHYARLLTRPPFEDPPDPPPEDDRITLVVVGDEHVVATGPGADTPGTWSVVTPGGVGRIGPVSARTPAGIRRPFTPLSGTVTPSHGVLTATAHANAASSLDPRGTEVVIDGDVGALPAHHVPGDDLWAIGVHGRGGQRHESFRMLGPFVAAGHAAMAVSYRNDEDAPGSPDGRSHLGGTEWLDVVAAMDHARGEGARRIVLVGCSMGGAIVGQVLRNAPHDDVVGIVLDAPVVDWTPVAARAARELGVPGLAVRMLLPPTRAMARLRHDVDLQRLRLDPADLDMPTFVAHGTDDQVVPFAGSQVLAAARPDTITSLWVPGAGHVRSWNHDPATYELALRAWLARRVGTRTPVAA